MSASIVAQLLWLESDSPEKPITMYINSPGGSVTSGAFPPLRSTVIKVHSGLRHGDIRYDVLYQVSRRDGVCRRSSVHGSYLACWWCARQALCSSTQLHNDSPAIGWHQRAGIGYFNLRKPDPKDTRAVQPDYAISSEQGKGIRQVYLRRD